MNLNFDFVKPQQPVFPARRWNVLDYGARGDSRQMNTGAFRAAIEACHAAGGGHVDIPAGCYRTGPIHLLSNVDLHLAQGPMFFSAVTIRIIR